MADEKASTLLTVDEKKSIEKAVAEAEQLTAGDIVPVVATVSGRYERAHDIFGLLFAVMALTVIWVAFPGPSEDKWSAHQASAVGLFGIITVIVVGFIVGATLATHFPLLGALFIPRSEMKDEVEKRAAEVFYSHHIRRTVGGMGVLIYLSLHERMVRVLADDAVTTKIPPHDWACVHAAVVEGMRRGHPAAGLEKAIREAGALLARHFPVQAVEKKKLPKSIVHFD